MSLLARPLGLILVPLDLPEILDVQQLARRGWVDPRCGQLSLERSALLLREELLPGQMLGSLEGGEGLGRPVALEVRVSPRHPRDLGGFRGRLRRCRPRN